MALQSTTFEDSSSMYQDVMVGNSDAFIRRLSRSCLLNQNEQPYPLK